MTDNEIIKALEEYVKENEFEYFHSNTMGEYPLIRKALDLINRLQDEIEKLEKETQNKERAYNDEFCLRKEWQTKCQELLKDKQTIKSEAYKEFAERLKEKSFETIRNYGLTKDVVEVCDIDDLLKELERKENTAYDD